MKKTFFALFSIVCLVSLSFSLAFGQQGTTTATSFVVQNLGSAPANVSISYNSDVGATSDVTSTVIAVGAAGSFDQRFQSTLPAGFIGSAFVSSDQPVGSVVNLLRSANQVGAVNAYESYNGFDTTSIGMSVRLPQILKAVSSAGLVYNTNISVQNTDTAGPASVTLVFTPDPTLNPVICQAPSTCIPGPVTMTVVIIAAGGTYNLDQGATSGIGDKFFGAVQVISDKAVAVQVTSTGAASNLAQVLLAYPSYTAGSTTPVYLPSVYKNLVSLGDSYSTAFLIANFGSTTATVTISYTAGFTGTNASEIVSVPPNGVANVDQRFTSASIGPVFLGAAVAQSTNGQPIAIMVNLRGGARYAMTYAGLADGGTKAYLPVGYKNISSQGYSFSSTFIVTNIGTSTTTITADFIDNRAGFPAQLGVNLGTLAPGETKQFDLRFSGPTAPTFFGAATINSSASDIAAMVQSRGSGGTGGDVLFAYRGLTP